MAKKQKASDIVDVNDLSAALKKAISKAFEQGAEEAFSGKSFLKDLNAQMKEYTKEQNAQRFNDTVRNRSLDKQISTQEAEVEILARIAKQKNNSVAQQLEMNRHTAYQGFLLAKMNGDLSKMAEFRKEFGKMGEEIKGLQAENALIDKQVEKRKEQIKQKLEENELDEKKDKVREKIEEVNKSLKAQIGITEELIDLLKTPEMAKAIFAEQTAEKLHEAYEGMEEFKKEGLTAGQAIQAQFKGLSLMSMLGLSDTKGALKGFAQEYGSIGGISRDVVDQVGQMAHHFGISGEEAAKLNAQLSMMPGETSKSAADAAEHVGHMAELQGIAPGKIMKDMAGNTAEMARAGNKGAEAFGKSVINLHKMGVEMATASKIADGLLDFESSINNQMEASVLLGREINLDKARELALSNDLEGATAEVLKNIGGSAEFGKLNRLQQDALAKSAGMTVEEMQKAIDAQEEQNKYYGEQAGLLDNILGKTMEIGGGVIGFLKENAMWMASTVQMLSQINIGKIRQYALDTAHWTKEKAHMLWKKVMGGGKGPAAAGMDKAVQSESNTPKDSGKSTGGLTRAIERINPTKLLAGAAALVLVAAAVFVFAKAAQEFANVSWESIGKAIVGLLALVGALALVGTIMMSGVGAVAILAGAAAMVIMAAALLVLGLAIQQIAKGFDMFVPALLQLVPMTAQIAIIAASFIVMGGGLMALGAASFIAFPGLMLVTFALTSMIPSLAIISAIAQQGALTAMGQGLLMMAAAGPGLGLVAISLMGIGAALGMIAISGLAALPVIGALTGLALVAPALTALADSLGGMGGGEKEGDEKMDTLISKIDELISISKQGGVVMLDGNKVGQALGYSIRRNINTSGVS